MPPRKTFLLRLSPELYAELRRWAEQERRSVNGQIEFLLREAVRRRTGREPGAAADDAQPPEESGGA